MGAIPWKFDSSRPHHFSFTYDKTNIKTGQRVNSEKPEDEVNIPKSTAISVAGLSGIGALTAFNAAARGLIDDPQTAMVVGIGGGTVAALAVAFGAYKIVKRSLS